MFHGKTLVDREFLSNHKAVRWPCLRMGCLVKEYRAPNRNVKELRAIDNSQGLRHCGRNSSGYAVQRGSLGLQAGSLMCALVHLRRVQAGRGRLPPSFSSSSNSRSWLASANPRVWKAASPPLGEAGTYRTCESKVYRIWSGSEWTCCVGATEPWGCWSNARGRLAPPQRGSRFEAARLGSSLRRKRP